MKHTTTFYRLADLLLIEVTRWPRSKEKKIELVLAGEARKMSVDNLRALVETVAEIKKDMNL